MLRAFLEKRFSKQFSSLTKNKAVVNGAVWIFLEQIVELSVRLVSSIVMTRLLFPEAFGLMALVGIVVFALNMFSDTGINTSIIRDERGEEEEFLNTAWTIQVIRGFILFFLCFLLAPYFSSFYEKPALNGMLLVLSLTFIIGGFTSMSIPLATRHIDLRRLTIAKIISQVIATIAMIIFGFIKPTVWALVVSAIVNPVVLVILSFTYVSNLRHRFRLEKEAVASLINFGKWVFFSSIAYFIATQADRLLLGYYIDIAVLGVYSIAIVLSEPVRGINWKLSSSLVYPFLGKTYRSTPENVSEAYYKMKNLSDAAFLTGVGGLAVLGPFVVEFIYDPRYSEAGWMLQILCLRLGFQCVARNMEHLLIVIGHVEFAFYQNMIRVFSVLFAIPVGWYFAQLEGVLWGLSISEIPVIALLYFGMIKFKMINVLLEIRSLVYPVVGFLLAYLIINIGIIGN